MKLLERSPPGIPLQSKQKKQTILCINNISAKMKSDLYELLALFHTSILFVLN